MIKYFCDMCGKPLLEGEDIRYVVKIEVYAAYESSDVPDEYDDMEALEETLDEPEDPEGQVEDESFTPFRFDLCPECHRRYLQDPLFKKANRRIGFSDN
ncbi:MAG TPA: hypothetical protein VM186_02400 [Planctomycetota bacterium]|nr:hypothetical protein [Planctomycetota bacterium]